MQNPWKSGDQRAIPVLGTPARPDAPCAGHHVDEVLRSQHYSKTLVLKVRIPSPSRARAALV